MQSPPTFHWDHLSDSISKFIEQPAGPGRHLSAKAGDAAWFELPKEKGEGYIEVFNFSDGLKMLILNCKWNDQASCEMIDGGYVRFNFSLKLDITMRMADETIAAHDPAWRLINNSEKSMSEEFFVAEAENLWVTLAFNESYLELLYGANIWQKHKILHDLKKQTGRTMHREYPFDHQINLVTSQIISLNVDDEIFCTMAHIKAKELFTLAIDRLVNSNSYTDEKRINLGASDKKALALAKEMLLSNIENPPTVKDLCTAVGINRNKLHYGFKAMFGLPPQQLLDDKRLSLAYEALQGSDKKVYQIAAEAGYSNQGSFATAFKRKFGLSPNKVRH